MLQSDTNNFNKAQQKNLCVSGQSTYPNFKAPTLIILFYFFIFHVLGLHKLELLRTEVQNFAYHHDLNLAMARNRRVGASFSIRTNSVCLRLIFLVVGPHKIQQEIRDKPNSPYSSVLKGWDHILFIIPMSLAGQSIYEPWPSLIYLYIISYYKGIH